MKLCLLSKYLLFSVVACGYMNSFTCGRCECADVSCDRHRDGGCRHRHDHTAEGAIVGGVAGGAVGLGIGAAVSGGVGAAVGGPIGLVAGLALGSAIGHEEGHRCHRHCNCEKHSRAARCRCDKDKATRHHGKDHHEKCETSRCTKRR